MNKRIILSILILLLTLHIGFSESCDLYIVTDRGLLVFLETILHFIMNLLMCWSEMYVMLFFIAIAGIILLIFSAFKRW